jgi:predicted ATPase/class 3 adenylate cyclase
MARDIAFMAAQPTGRVTLLFSDIEGSTRLLARLGAERYAEALDLHRRLLRDAFDRHGGYEVDYEGDAFFVAFASAQEALAAALEAQQALAAADWSEEGGIRVRMGLHTGEPLAAPPKYVGLDVHKAARIMAAGHGGQVLVSAATAEVAGGELKRLGEQRLKDFDEPVVLFQLGEGEFPPLKTISNTNLPRPASSFVGRAQELTDVAPLLRDGSRLVTLTGPGGSGKTRLAIEAAAELVGEFKAGVFWVGLASLRDSRLVLPTIAETLGAKEALAAHIGERELLLLLDNLEQVIDAASELSQLLETCPNLRLLVTSRELLRVRGEVEYEVLPLAEPEAVDLFCARARIDASVAVEELCRRLDNLPLALELAAARTKVLTPDEILERLSQRLDLLKGGRDADPRQMTLRATIEWSHDLLDEQEQRLFRRLAVFAGGCTLEAAEGVADADLNTLQSLVEKSLVRLTGDRYWMLETIREYATERLAGAEETDLYMSRLLERSLDLTCSLEPDYEGSDPVGFDRIEVEEDNVRAALEYALQSARTEEQLELVRYLVYFWLERGRLEEGLRWSERVAAAVRDEPLTKEKLRATSFVGEFLRFLGRPREAIAWKERALEESRALGLEREEAADLADLADIYLRLGDLQPARKLSLEALAIRERESDPRGIAHALFALPDVAVLEGNLDEALAVCDRIDSLVPDDEGVMRRGLDTMRAEVYRRCGDEGRAAASVVAAADNALRTGGRDVGLAEALLIAADLVAARTPAAAAQLVASARRLCRETGYSVGPLVDYERITAAVEADPTEELAVDDALRLVLDCLGSGDSRP